MSTFWESLQAEFNLQGEATTVEQSKATTIEEVWESIPEQGLEELGSDCVHYFIIPTGQREVIGQCNRCNGERWFKNYLDEPKFNRTLVTTEQKRAYADAEQSSGELIPDIIGVIA